MSLLDAIISEQGGPLWRDLGRDVQYRPAAAAPGDEIRIDDAIVDIITVGDDGKPVDDTPERRGRRALLVKIHARWLSEVDRNREDTILYGGREYTIARAVTSADDRGRWRFYCV